MKRFHFIYYEVISIIYVICIFLNFSYGHGTSSVKVLLISLDGFRHDYFDIAERAGIKLSNFQKVFIKGTKADHFNNLFITRTFPNHISIITGCYEERHGIIDNEFFDPLFNETFSIKNLTQNFQSKWFDAVEPIWVTNQRNHHKSAIIYWPGQLAPYRDKYYPTYSFGVYDGGVSLDYKIDAILNWLADKGTTLGLLYHPHPDIEGHKFGTNSSVLLRVLSEIDYSIGYLLSSIESKGLTNVLNVVIVSDHGMSDISISKKVLLDMYIDTSMYHKHRQESYTMWGLWPKDDVNLTSLLISLSLAPHTRVYLKENIPAEWHYKRNRRIAPIIVVAEEGWILVHDDNETVTDKGAHGYIASSDNMKGIFVAWGPNIVANKQSKTIVREVDLFPLIAELLALESLPEIDGNLAAVRWILQKNGNDENVFSSLIMVCLLALLCALTVCIMVSCAHYHAKSLHVQKVSQTYALQTDKLMRRRQNNNQKSFSWMAFSKHTKPKKKKPKAADTAFLLESSSGNDDDILGDVAMGTHKVTS